MTTKEWMLKHITKNPMISHGSLWRDFCFSSRTTNVYSSSFYESIKELKDTGKINVISEGAPIHNTFYDLGTQLKRDKILNELF